MQIRGVSLFRCGQEPYPAQAVPVIWIFQICRSMKPSPPPRLILPMPGGEIEVVATSMNGVTINAGLGYANIEIDKYNNLTIDYSGNKVTYSPEYTYNPG